MTGVQHRTSLSSDPRTLNVKVEIRDALELRHTGIYLIDGVSIFRRLH